MVQAQFSGVGSEAVSEGVNIGFEVPYGHLMPIPERGSHVWRMIQFVFELPPLRFAAPLSVDTDLARVERFVSKGKEIAQSPYFEDAKSVSRRITPDSVEVETQFPHRESTVGFLVLFRQFFEPNEPASYAAVHRVVRRALELEDRTDEVALLDQWGRVHKKLRLRKPKTWLDLKLSRLQTDQVSRHDPNLRADLSSPRIGELLETYLYGDFVHYGDRNGQLEELLADPISAATHEMTLHEGVTGLSMFYLGVADALERCGFVE